MKEQINTQLVAVENWTPEQAQEIYNTLEHPNWAPWLEASEQTIAERAMVFPEGQLLISEGSQLLASLSMNQINWDGNSNTLPSWDVVAGLNTTNYSETFQPHGNTLVLMSMNVSAEAKGKQLPTHMIQYVKQLAGNLGIEHLVGSFRPTGYGEKKREFNFNLPFWDYCQMTKDNTDKPIDPWLRSLSWNGMKMIKEDPQAMVVPVSLEEFNQYKEQYKPNDWLEIKPNVWECGEVGNWVVDMDKATYTESNVWGMLPLTD